MNKEAEKSPRRVLGKGLSALLPNHPKAENQPTGRPRAVEHSPVPESAKSSLPDQFEEFLTVEVRRIEPGEGQPREAFDEGKLEELAQSIRAHGVLQPVTVYRVGPDRFRLIAGERRWRAAERAGLAHIPVLVRSVNPGELLQLALIENIQREDLNPIEIAVAFQKLVAEHHLSHEQIAEKTGKDRSTVSNFLRLLKLSPQVRADLVSGSITMGHARALLNIQDADQQIRACEAIKQRQLSVRETESLVRSLTQAAKSAREEQGTDGQEKAPLDPNIRAAIERLEMALGTKVRLVARSEKSGRIEIEYYSREDLDRIYGVIVGE